MVESLAGGRGRLRSWGRSGRKAAIVFLAESNHGVPERLRLAVGYAGCEQIEMGVPTGAHAERGLTVWDAVVDDRQKNFVALRFQFERDVADLRPIIGKPVGRMQIGDTALHPVFLIKAFRAMA